MKRFWVILVGVVAVLVVIFVLGNKGQSGTSTSSTAPEISGIKCETEMVKVHNHVHLTMLNDGKNVELPAGIGIKTDAGCLYWLHTHETDGIIHVESPGRADFTLGDFFNVWGQTLSQSEAGPLKAGEGQSLRFYVNGQTFSGDPKSIPLNQHDVLTIESGQEVTPPNFNFPSGL
jgi:hypothetical protein